MQTTTTEKKAVKLTVRAAVLQAFNNMPDTFYSLDLCDKAGALLKNRTMHGTLLRRLRELRNDGLCVYKVIDSQAGQYKKVA